MTVPPGGFAGAAQMTPASQAALSGGLRLQRATKSRTGKKAKKRYARNARVIKGPSSKGPKKRRTKKNGGSKLVKGSPAAKKFMAALRKKRKK